MKKYIGMSLEKRWDGSVFDPDSEKETSIESKEKKLEIWASFCNGECVEKYFD